MNPSRFACFLAVVLSIGARIEAPAAILAVPLKYPTIQAAVDASADGDTISVTRGSYGSVSIKSRRLKIEWDWTAPSSSTVSIRNLNLDNSHVTVSRLRFDGTVAGRDSRLAFILCLFDPLETSQGGASLSLYGGEALLDKCNFYSASDGQTHGQVAAVLRSLSLVEFLDCDVAGGHGLNGASGYGTGGGCDWPLDGQAGYPALALATTGIVVAENTKLKGGDGGTGGQCWCWIHPGGYYPCYSGGNAASGCPIENLTPDAPPSFRTRGLTLENGYNSLSNCLVPPTESPNTPTSLRAATIIGSGAPSGFALDATRDQVLDVADLLSPRTR